MGVPGTGLWLQPETGEISGNAETLKRVGVGAQGRLERKNASPPGTPEVERRRGWCQESCSRPGGPPPEPPASRPLCALGGGRAGAVRPAPDCAAPRAHAGEPHRGERWAALERGREGRKEGRFRRSQLTPFILGRPAGRFSAPSGASSAAAVAAPSAWPSALPALALDIFWCLLPAGEPRERGGALRASGAAPSHAPVGRATAPAAPPPAAAPRARGASASPAQPSPASRPPGRRSAASLEKEDAAP